MPGARMAFKGPYPTVFSGHTTAMVISHTTFSGGVTNTGTIGTGGISVVSGAFLSGGGILDTGTILGGINVDSSSKIVTTAGTGIALLQVSTFLGAIRNSGTISAAKQGIHLSSFGVFGNTSAASGIVNSGRIVAQGDGVEAFNSGFNGSAFFGGIRNAGTISAGQSGIFAFRDGTFEGGLTNTGMISAGRSGINVGQEATFGGKISNSGRISAGRDRYFLQPHRCVRQHHRRRHCQWRDDHRGPSRHQCFRGVDISGRHRQRRHDQARQKAFVSIASRCLAMREPARAGA